jgi:hypothetical protein
MQFALWYIFSPEGYKKTFHISFTSNKYSISVP